MLRNWIVLLPLTLAAEAPQKSSELFVTNKVWTVHLSFSAAEWAAMEPKGGPGPGMGMRGPGGVSPAMLIAPAFLKGDQNGDGKLSRAELDGLGERWFAEWDTAKSGKVTNEQFGAGWNSMLEMPGPGGPPMPPPKGKKNGLSGMSGTEFVYVRAALDFEGQSLPEVAVRYKGNSTFMMSRRSLKRSMKIDLNRYTKDGTLAGVTTLNLHSGVADMSMMNETLSHRLYRDAQVPAPRTAYAKVYVTVAGKYDRQYLGLYSLVEDVDQSFLHDRYPAKGGALFKPVTRKLFEDLGPDWEAYEQVYDAKTKLTVAQKNRVREFAQLVSHATDEEFTARLGEFLNLDEFARYMATTVWLSTLDSLLSMGQNFYVYLNPQTNKFEFLPWDLDQSFGHFGMGSSPEQREQLSIMHPWQGTNRFLERVYQVEAFRQVYRTRLTEFSRTNFEPGRLAKQVDEVAAAIRPAIEAESAEKVAKFDRVVAGEAVEGFGPGIGPGMGPGMGGGFGRAKPIKGFVGPRAESVRLQLAGKSVGLIPTGGGPGAGPPGGFPGPGVMMGRMIFSKFDTNRDGTIARDELRQTLGRWFASWNVDGSGQLTAEQLRAGITKDLIPAMPFGPPGMGGPGMGGPGMGGPGMGLRPPQ